MQALLQGVEVEAAGASTTTISPSTIAAVRQALDERLAQLGKVAVERAQVAALDRDLAGGRKTMARKPSHFGSNR